MPGIGFCFAHLAQRRRAMAAPAMTAAGGTAFDILENDRSYRVHRFDSSAVLSVTGSGTAEVLVIGGGGGGSTAGGGAGGVILAQVALTAGDWPVVIGDGGAGIHGGASPRPTPASPGQDSRFAGLIALGGGPGSGTDGGADITGDEANGGSGGGGGSSSKPGQYVSVSGGAQQPGSSSGGLGHDGGDATLFSLPFYAGGGGGAGGPAPEAGGAWAPGGAGITTTIAGTPLDVGGGGAGGRWTSGTGLAGTHGGGSGGSGSPRDAAPNTGGGGGGGSSNATGGTGGAGLVIIRYRI